MHPKRTRLAGVPFAVLASIAMTIGSAASAGELSVGDRAPDFEMLGSDGRSYSLTELLAEGGTDGVVLAWFPKAFTPG